MVAFPPDRGNPNEETMKSVLHGYAEKTEEKGKQKTPSLDKVEFKTPVLSVSIIWWFPVHCVL